MAKGGSLLDRLRVAGAESRRTLRVFVVNTNAEVTMLGDRHSAAEAGFSGSRGEGAVKVTRKKEGEPHLTVSELVVLQVRHPYTQCSLPLEIAHERYPDPSLAGFLRNR